MLMQRKRRKVLKLYAQANAKIEKVNAKYQTMANKHRQQHVFQFGGFVWLYTRKEQFSNLRQNKLVSGKNLY